MAIFWVERNSFRSIAESVPRVENKRNGMNSVLRLFSAARPLCPKIKQLDLGLQSPLGLELLVDSRAGV